MPTNDSTPKPATPLFKTDFVVPESEIEDFLGLGLAYSEWPAEIEKRGYAWYPGLEKIIIEREWEFFRPEIQRLRLEPIIVQSSRSKSNSLASILKRLKGEPWLNVKGHLDEREERLRTHRLLGKDAKVRCLQHYVHRWDHESAFSASSDLAAQTAPNQSLWRAGLALENHPTCGSSEEINLNDVRELERRLAPGMVNIKPQTRHSNCNHDSQLKPTIVPLLTPPTLTTGEFKLFQDFQNAVALRDADNSDPCLESEPLETSLNDKPAASHDAIMVLLDHSPIREDGVPTSSWCNQTFDISEKETDVLNWMENYPVSENFEPPETEAPCSDQAFEGNIFGCNNNFDTKYRFDFEEIKAFGATSTVEIRSGDLSAQHILQAVSAEVGPQSISLPQVSSRKRRRPNSATTSLEIDDCRNTTTLATIHVASDRNIVMSDYESGSQHTDEVVSQRSLAQPVHSSALMLAPQCQCVARNNSFVHIRTQIELESEVKRARAELNLVRKQQQKELQSCVRERQAAEDENSELRRQLQEVKLMTEHYEALVRNLMSDKIILQDENARIKGIDNSALLPTGAKDRELSKNPVHIFPPSKSPRQLSLVLRSATVNKEVSSPSRKLSTSTLQDMTACRFPVATNSSSRPDSADSNRLSSGHPSSVFSPLKPTERKICCGSTDTVANLNLSTSTNREPNHLQQFMQKFSKPFLRKQSRDDFSKATQSVPILPPLETSVPLNRQMARVLVDGDKRLTNDSGYGSLRLETSSIVSRADNE